MFPDISTLSLILCLTNSLQIVAIFVQYYITRSKAGQGWWLTGYILIAASFAAVSFMPEALLSPQAILFNDFFFTIGVSFLYIGVLHFLGKRENTRRLLIAGAGFSFLLIFFNFIYGSPPAARTLVSASVACLSILSARELLQCRKAEIRSSRRFLAAIFLLNSLFFLTRALTAFIPFAFLRATDPTRQQTLEFLLILFVTVLLTFGFIILVNRSVHADSVEMTRNLQRIFNSNPDALIITRLSDGVVVDANDGFQYHTGYCREEIVGKTTLDIHFWQNPKDRFTVLSTLRREENIENMESIFIRKNGSPYIGLVTSRLFPLQGVPHILTVIRDITKAKALETALRESEEKYRFMTENSGDVIWHLDGNYCFDYISPADERLRGFKNEEVIGVPVWRLFKPEAVEPLKKLNAIRLAEEQNGIRTGTENYELEVIRKDGSWIWTEVSVTPHHDANGNLVGLHGITHDITERKRLQEELQRQANTDSLTGLFNRRYFLEVASAELNRAIRHKHDLSLVQADIDHLKQVNDTYGHAAGDMALRMFAEICQKNMRTEDVLARFGGDEFVLLFPETSAPKAFQIVERIRQILDETTILHDGHLISITISSGLATLAGENETVDSLLGRADIALYQAKAEGRNRVTSNPAFNPRHLAEAFRDD